MIFEIYVQTSKIVILLLVITVKVMTLDIEIVATNGIHQKLECGPMPNPMAALPNIGGALCSTPQSLADAHY